MPSGATSRPPHIAWLLGHRQAEFLAHLRSSEGQRSTISAYANPRGMTSFHKDYPRYIQACAQMRERGMIEEVAREDFNRIVWKITPLGLQALAVRELRQIHKGVKK